MPTDYMKMMDSQSHKTDMFVTNMSGPHYGMIAPMDSSPQHLPGPHHQHPALYPLSIPAQLGFNPHNLSPDETVFNKAEKLSASVMTDHRYQTESTQLTVPLFEDKPLQKAFIRKTLSNSAKVLLIVSVDLLMFAIVKLLSYSTVLQIFFGRLGALLYTLFLTVDCLSGQLAMSTQTYNLHFENYILFALNIFLDIFMIFLYVRQIFLVAPDT